MCAPWVLPPDLSFHFSSTKQASWLTRLLAEPPLKHQTGSGQKTRDGKVEGFPELWPLRWFTQPSQHCSLTTHPECTLPSQQRSPQQPFLKAASWEWGFHGRKPSPLPFQRSCIATCWPRGASVRSAWAWALAQVPEPPAGSRQ